jgi:hypothetical protein
MQAIFIPLVGGDALQPADRDGLLLHASAPASRLARPVAHATENAGKDIGVTVHHVRVGEPALSNQADVLGNVCVGRTCPLAIYDSMKVVGMRSVSRLH